MTKPMRVSTHTADGATSPSLKRVYAVSAAATTAGTVAIKNGVSGATVVTLLVPINDTRTLTNLDIPTPLGAYVDVTTFAGTVHVYGG